MEFGLAIGKVDLEKSLATTETSSIPELIVYWDINFGGASVRTNLGYSYVGDYWNDQISSFIIVSGIWQFYIDINFSQPCGKPLGPGYYKWVEDYGIPNDSISSFQIVGLT